ncbi:nucleotidyltransferase domain-containing protein [Thiomicrorhabdus sp. Milos-T2]|uniref:nucleotidyltransferase domain-containing protein n=1 Tax=Thiomicrorhabdus sp. Milos-T2 TaxID=90814 RepID=UPI0004940F79|nr:nucleotidyltransferase domain-containing protein [Thiomicrorhabdus sp. Milos-T2]
MFGLSDQTIFWIRQVFAGYPAIKQVIIYGSRAKGNYRPGSDIDLTLIGNAIDNAILSRVLVDLDELNTPYLMDISIFEQIESQDLIEHIQRVGQVFYDIDYIKSSQSFA